MYAIKSGTFTQNGHFGYLQCGPRSTNYLNCASLSDVVYQKTIYIGSWIT